MDTMILAELTSRWAFSGVLCLAAIPCLIVVALVYATGPWSGSCTCFGIFVIAVFLTTDNNSAAHPAVSGRNMFHSNASKTKWISQADIYIDEPGSIYNIRRHGTVSTLDDTEYFLPAKELYDDNGTLKLKTTGEKAEWDDYYLLDDPVDGANMYASEGGVGIPQWIYHPAAPVYIFGAAGLPALLGGMFLAGKLFG